MSHIAIIARRLLFNLNLPLFGGADIFKEYLANKKSAKQIAREVDCSHSTILKHLKAQGLKLKERGHTMSGDKWAMGAGL